MPALLTLCVALALLSSGSNGTAVFNTPNPWPQQKCTLGKDIVIFGDSTSDNGNVWLQNNGTKPISPPWNHHYR